ncbi:hypothetical protein [Candidatus Nanohalovita haloferacivicina]|uniref:hypothetical protein n=1 Tax=Candidatus Nanohalovita haloferacivicina TaxID=2978046 RepID=UPI00325FB98F|nr:hypothetical protein HBNXNv_0592 [Candidatus Nanohalobia archaeon BNXNv]
MLSEDERVEYEELMEGRFTMSGYGPGSEEQERKSELKNMMWQDIGLETLFSQGEITTGKFNRKDPYENIGYQGHFNIELDQENWDEPMTYMPSFDLDYRDQTLELTAGDTEITVEEGEQVTEINTAEQVQEVVEEHLEI